MEINIADVPFSKIRNVMENWGGYTFFFLSDFNRKGMLQEVKKLFGEKVSLFCEVATSTRAQGFYYLTNKT